MLFAGGSGPACMGRPGNGGSPATCRACVRGAARSSSTGRSAKSSPPPMSPLRAARPPSTLSSPTSRLYVGGACGQNSSSYPKTTPTAARTRWTRQMPHRRALRERPPPNAPLLRPGGQGPWARQVIPPFGRRSLTPPLRRPAHRARAAALRRREFNANNVSVQMPPPSEAAAPTPNGPHFTQPAPAEDVS